MSVLCLNQTKIPGLQRKGPGFSRPSVPFFLRLYAVVGIVFNPVRDKDDVGLGDFGDQETMRRPARAEIRKHPPLSNSRLGDRISHPAVELIRNSPEPPQDDGRHQDNQLGHKIFPSNRNNERSSRKSGKLTKSVRVQGSRARAPCSKGTG